ncbi:hypothetical protein [Nonomuraea sp. NPDC049725]|uniref:hypothetical protein n=1 Tax=Nonomuraea sp. NPDC049725 TaxID=3154508 RepID=UPI0034396CF9
MSGAGKSRREEIAVCLASFPDGATVDEVAACFGHVNTREHFRRQLRLLVAAGVAVKVVTTQRKAFAGDYARGPLRRVKFRLVDPTPGNAPGADEGQMGEGDGHG